MKVYILNKRRALDEESPCFAKIPRLERPKHIDFHREVTPPNISDASIQCIEETQHDVNNCTRNTVHLFLKVGGKQINVGEIPKYDSSNYSESPARNISRKFESNDSDQDILDSLFIGNTFARTYFETRKFHNIWSSSLLGLNSDFLKRYRLIKKIGEGGYGQVFYARRNTDNKLVAVKVFQKGTLNERAHHSINTSHISLKMVPTEVNAMIELEGVPGVVQLYEVYHSPPTDYILVMDTFHDVRSLKEYLHVKGRLTEEEACRYFKQIVLSLNSMYERKRHHFDLKCSNILIDSNLGKTMIIDFGGAQRVLRRNFKKWVGTKKNFPPEYFSHKKFYGIPVESWSLGLILLQMTTGHSPVSSNQQENFNRTYEVPTFLSEDLRDLIDQCLSRNPRNRPNFKKILDSSWLQRLEKVHYRKDNEYRQPVVVKYSLCNV